MAEPTPPPAQPAAGTGATYKPPTPPKKQNPALKMMGLPNLPRKLPSRNWMIFFAVTGSFASAVIYDKREKNRATAKWRHVVEPLAKEPIGSANQLPRKLTIYLASPPGDGLRVAQDHFIEYAKPVLAASGLDWEFVQARQQGDVRAAVAEKIRRARRQVERPDEEVAQTDEMIVEELRKKLALPEWEGVKGDVVFGRHAWKEYIRGLHEGWLGPLDPPAQPEPSPKPAPIEPAPVAEKLEGDLTGLNSDDKPEEKKEDEKKEEKKPDRPPQPPPYNTIEDYSQASIPSHIPYEFSPANPISFPHRLGFRHTFVRLGRFLSRRKLADDIGRDVAAVCFAAASREWRETESEQQSALEHEEKDWPKTVWKDEVVEDEDVASRAAPKERIWTSPIVVDQRLTQRMRRFEMTAEIEARAAAIKVPEEEIEGWIKGSLRSIWRWGADSWNTKPMRPNVGNIDDE
ncbi:Fc.00g068060.m01.CDS01 [Cosmosporella sp. VM-42]